MRFDGARGLAAARALGDLGDFGDPALDMVADGRYLGALEADCV